LIASQKDADVPDNSDKEKFIDAILNREIESEGKQNQNEDYYYYYSD
jgi:hypothetical protein